MDTEDVDMDVTHYVITTIMNVDQCSLSDGSAQLN